MLLSRHLRIGCLLAGWTLDAAGLGCSSDPASSATGVDAAAALTDASADATTDPTTDLDASVDAPPPPDGAAPPDAGATCPAGSTLLKALTSCPGAPLVPPPSLATALADAGVGDIVALDGMNEPSAPCLPVVVCSPSDAPTLLFSDSPESPSQDGVLYADTVSAGRYRLYVYHTNGGAPPRKFPIVVLNQGAQPAKVTLGARGRAPLTKAYVTAGKDALAGWFASSAPVDVTVPAGQRVLLDPLLDDLHATKDQLVHAIYDVVTDAPLKFSFVSVPANADAVAATAGLSLLPRDPDHQRGTFPKADVLITNASAGTSSPTGKGVRRLRLGANEVDPILDGIDATTGDPQKVLGNYGVRYRLALDLPGSSGVSSAITPRGGAWAGVGRHAQGPVVRLPAQVELLGSSTSAITLGGGAATSVNLSFFSGGGSNLPVDFFVVAY